MPDQTEVEFPYSLSSLSETWPREGFVPRPMEQQLLKPSQDEEEIIYSFYQPDVRRKLLKLIKTDVVRIMDKNFMQNLQEKLYQSYWQDFEQRLVNRRAAEAERRKKLALRGVQPLDNSSLDDHPILQVSKQVQDKMQLLKAKRKKPAQKLGNQIWEYVQFETLSELESEPSEVSLVDGDIGDLDSRRKTRRRLEGAVEEALEVGQLPALGVVEALRYESALVKQLRKLQTVEELYDMADKILSVKGLSVSQPQE